ncbi:MAG: hypothetical protein V3T05_01530, partial [Myxococcota bacterium]
RKLYRLTLPGKTDELQLTAGEDIEPQVSPDGKWVAYAKAKLPGGSDYHDFNFWRLYVVSIHGADDGREENKIDDNGYWPSWGKDGKLYYSQVDGNHTNIMRAVIDDYGRLVTREVFFSTRDAFPDVPEVNECFMSPDASWFAARTRQTAKPGVGAYSITPPVYHHLAQAGAVGCMPLVAPSGDWGLIAGSEYGIRWGDSPGQPPRITDQLLIRAHGSDGHCYHPGVSSDEQWVMAGHANVQRHNDGPYDIYIYRLEGRVASGEQLLVGGGFNGWPNVWVGEPTEPPPPVPVIDDFHPSSYTIVTGESVDLSWEISFADGATLDGTPVGLAETTTMSPTGTTTYTLVVENSLNPGVIDSEEVTVTVNATAQPVVIGRFTVGPESITAGESAQLSWQVTYPTTLEITGPLDSIDVPPSGTMTVEPVRTTTYTLTALGHPGPVTAEVVLKVDELEKIQPATLPDRGGFLCSSSGGEAVALWAMLLAVARWVRRRRRD